MTMGKYSKKAQEKIAEVMQEFKKGKLKSSSGEKVTKRDQAIAIAISEADSEGLKVPNQKKTPITKKIKQYGLSIKAQFKKIKSNQLKAFGFSQ